MENFTPLASALGGALIGVSASLMLLFSGRIAGISGVLGGALGLPRGDMSWRALFLAGLLIGGLVMAALQPQLFAMEITRSPAALIAAGLLVGVGTRMGNGCTSGHGVCGISRLSRRSLVATATFMAAGVATATVVGQVFGGAL